MTSSRTRAASEAAVEGGNFDPIPDHFESAVGSGYLTSGQPRALVERAKY